METFSGKILKKIIMIVLRQKQYIKINKVARFIVGNGLKVDKSVANASKAVEKVPKVARVNAKLGYYRTGPTVDKVVRFGVENPVTMIGQVQPIPGGSIPLTVAEQAGLKKIPAYARTTKAWGEGYSRSAMSKGLRGMPSISSGVNRLIAI